MNLIIVIIIIVLNKHQSLLFCTIYVSIINIVTIIWSQGNKGFCYVTDKAYIELHSNPRLCHLAPLFHTRCLCDPLLIIWVVSVLSAILSICICSTSIKT